MAEDTRHAAWQDKREFSIRLVPADGPARDLVTGFTDFLAAVDYVTEWLDREDPSCTDDQKLVIVQTEGGVSSEVFSYPPPEERDPGQGLVERYGFNPAAPRFVPGERSKPKLDRLSSRIAHAPETLPRSAQLSSLPGPSRVTGSDEPVAATVPAPASEAIEQPLQPHRRPMWRTNRHSIVSALRLFWDDRASRSCVIVATLSIWLTVALADATFLVPLLASGTALWFLRHRRPVAESDADDWL